MKDNFNIDIEKAIAFILNEMAEIRTEITYVKSLCSVLTEEAYPEKIIDADSEFLKIRESVKQKMLQLYLDTLSIESEELRLKIQSLFGRS